jgi:uncharacterized membrane protein
MLRTTLIALLLASAAVPARAHDDHVRTAVGAGLGAAVGAVIGSELGGRNEAILGGAIGGALGTAIATSDRRQHHNHYSAAPQHNHYWEAERRHKRGFCPPGLAKQGRC